MKTLLVIECDNTHNWYDVFKGEKLFVGQECEEDIVIEQAPWTDISLSATDGNEALVTIRPQARPHPGTTQASMRVVKPDFILMRSVSHGIQGQDSRNLLYGLMFANVPSVNSLESVYFCLERPLVYAELARIRDRLGGKDAFPLIPQHYYPHHRAMVVGPDYPCVAKMGHAHAGYGKIKLGGSSEFDDFRSLFAMTSHYATAEPFIAWDYDIRIQKIGNHYRAFRRVSTNWKGNVGNASVNTDMEMTDEFKLWIDECAKAFGGLDICALDAVHSSTDGKYYILELNDTAIGLVHRHADEDKNHVRDLVVLKMEAHFASKSSGISSAAAASTSATAESNVVSKERETEIALAREQRKVKELEAQLSELKLRLKDSDAALRKAKSEAGDGESSGSWFSFRSGKKK